MGTSVWGTSSLARAIKDRESPHLGDGISPLGQPAGFFDAVDLANDRIVPGARTELLVRTLARSRDRTLAHRRVRR